jgi:hypothetical protein
MILASLVARGGAQDPSISETFLRILPSNLLSRASLPSRLHNGGGGVPSLVGAVLENAAEHVGVTGQTMDTVMSL